MASKLNLDRPIDLLKMDCEGGEMDCLFGADKETLAKVNRIELEYHEWAGFSFEELAAHLVSCGFSLSGREHNARDKTGNATFTR
jgi:hypothetical protein